MSGHSHWATIRRKKESNDAKKGAIFTKLAREIVIAVREGGGGDPDSNLRLRMVLDKARTMGMPHSNVDRAVKRGTGEDKEGVEIVEATYEGYAPNGVALLIDIVTDNRNRSVAALRHTLTRGGGSLASSGAVAWQFDRKGSISVSPEIDFDTLFEAAVEAGAEDVVEGGDEDSHEVYTGASDLHAVSQALKEAGIPVGDAELVMIPQNKVSLEDKEAVHILRLISSIEELEDVMRVFSNLDITEEAVAAFAKVME